MSFVPLCCWLYALNFRLAKKEFPNFFYRFNSNHNVGWGKKKPEELNIWNMKASLIKNEFFFCFNFPRYQMSIRAGLIMPRELALEMSGTVIINLKVTRKFHWNLTRHFTSRHDFVCCFASHWLQKGWGRGEKFDKSNKSFFFPFCLLSNSIKFVGW